MEGVGAIRIRNWKARFTEPHNMIAGSERSQEYHAACNASFARWVRCFELLCSCILGLAGIAKLGSLAIGDTDVLRFSDPVLPVSRFNLYLSLGLIETGVAFVLAWPVPRLVLWKSGLIAGFASAFVAYRVRMAVIGVSANCPCLGSAFDALPISKSLLTHSLTAGLAIMFVGSFGVLAFVNADDS